MKRRNFVAKSSLSGLAALLGVDIIYKEFMPLGYTPVALQESDPFKLFNKDKGMVVLNDKPWNIEAQAHLLDDRVTPNK
ncbi:MAG: molybdopterin containing oxidoreductase, partial [Maribacter dokdonensis]